MAIAHTQIDEWLRASSEHQRLEFKEAKTSFLTEKLNQYCVALANEGGGHLLLGVSDRPPREVTGTSAFPNPVKVEERLFQKIGFRVDVEEVPHPDGRVLVFHVPARPRGTAYDLDGRYLMRSGSSLVAMSEDRLRAIFAEGEPDWLERHSKTNLTTAQVAELLDLEAYFELIGLPYSGESEPNVERLVAERLVDRESGLYAIRRIGALLLARDLGDFPDVQRKAVRTIVYPGNSKLETQLDQTEKRGYALGFQDVVGFVMEQLPREVIENGLRRTGTLVPEIAVRELVANALIHQDFSISGTSVLVEIYRDRVEISNPGEPIVPIERFIDGYRSRNERLANLMRRMGICEERSSGVDRVIHAVELGGLPPPAFSAGYRRTLVRIFGRKPFAEMSREERIQACYQHCALRWVEDERMTNQSLRKRFQLAAGRTNAISQIIKMTIDAELIKPDKSVGGSKKYARYLPFWA
ncbi:MAG: MloB [Gammaproteobacteria bacterium]|nr:MloB [Gammaproteobacteria bacterium]MYK83599.1 MloB [Gammaproteobacteria bacterium]